MNASGYRFLPAWGLVVTAALLPSCRQAAPKVESPPPRQSAVPKAEQSEPDSPEASTAPADVVEAVTVPAEFDWLHVDAVRPKADGGWATGDFLEPRNKIDIHTRGVKQFSIDLSQLNIHWDRLVVIGIDGRNAELRKRDVDVIHIARDEQGRWVVLEP